ncbi:FAD/NAD(P)-binding domain-containing protein [Hesseltinella vesiculosa]|uniref:FAD/NAD(P)-binding domain-containing protein n=1 Tax=Hesseltinella vesiculosa TaxID=101127 RepID=A0A1X2GT53_9FUNG|nr:FAD/NAD(P)-binding domain-containing protein [Hesseltinella vesiculosa]
MEGSPMELNVTTKKTVASKIEQFQWTIIDKPVAIGILYETEREVMAMLHGRLSDYLQTQNEPVSNIMKVPSMDRSRIRVCIIGGGFVGFTVASILDPMPAFHVTLVDSKASFEYTPGVLKKLVNPGGSTSLRVNHDSYIHNGQVIIGYACEVDERATEIMVNDEWLSFDYLVIGTGSSYNASIKSTDISTLYRLSGLEDWHAELLAAETILIIGGGLVGCELASEIMQTRFPGKFPVKKVTIVEANESLVPRSSVENQNKALEFLTGLGVRVVCHERITEFETADACNLYIGSSGKHYEGYDKVFLTTGTVPNSGFLAHSPSLGTCVDDQGRIKVKATLQLDHWLHTHIFAGGDVTNVMEEKTGYAATLAGVCIARNICRMVKGKQPLKQGDKGTLAAPAKPLHGNIHHGGIGKQKLGSLKKAFSFLNQSWAALKYFDEIEFMKLVQGQRPQTGHGGVIGKLPRPLSFDVSSGDANKLAEKRRSKRSVPGESKQLDRGNSNQSLQQHPDDLLHALDSWSVSTDSTDSPLQVPASRHQDPLSTLNTSLQRFLDDYYLLDDYSLDFDPLPFDLK